VLGLRAVQLNRDVVYPGGHDPFNQLEVWSDLGLLTAPLQPGLLEETPRLAAIGDESRSVEERVRAYWDSNCAMCHGVTQLYSNWDARFSTPLPQQGLLLRPPFAGSSPNGDVLLDPGNPSGSIIYQRSISTDPNRRMPPIGRTTEDEAYVELLEQWITSLASRPPG